MRVTSAAGSGSLFGRILPSCVVVRECRIADATGVLSPDEERHVRSAVARRRREFLAGRCCAHAALRELGQPAASLPSRPDRVPDWPAAVVGSITHSDRYCAAAVARRAHVRALGIDIEEMRRFDVDLIRMVCTSREARAIAERPEREWRRIGALLFSAKESVFKCQFPLTSMWVGFHDVEIELVPGRAEFIVDFVNDVCRTSIPQPLQGRYAFDEEAVATSVLVAEGSERVQ